jgi:hypothetical protein
MVCDTKKKRGLNKEITKREALIKKREALIKKREAQIEKREALIKKYGALIKTRDAQIEKRDALIKKYLLSPSEADRMYGLELLDTALRKPVASVLLRTAWEAKSPAYREFLNPRSTILEGDAFKEVWQETMMSVWKNIKRQRFHPNGSLFAYVAKIADRRTHDRWRKQHNIAKRIDRRVELGEVECTRYQHERLMALLEDIERFYDSLPEEKRVILELGVALARENGSGRGTREQHVAHVNAVYLKKGWKIRSVDAIVREYSRLRTELRKFLIERGHHG